MPVVPITMWNKKNGVSESWLVPHLLSTVSTSAILNLKYWRIAQYGVVYLFFIAFGKSILYCFKMSFDVLNSRLKIFNWYILSNQCTEYIRLPTIKTWKFSAYPINIQFKDIIQGSNNQTIYIRRYYYLY